MSDADYLPPTLLPHVIVPIILLKAFSKSLTPIQFILEDIILLLDFIFMVQGHNIDDTRDDYITITIPLSCIIGRSRYIIVSHKKSKQIALLISKLGEYASPHKRASFKVLWIDIIYLFLGDGKSYIFPCSHKLRRLPHAKLYMPHVIDDILLLALQYGVISLKTHELLDDATSSHFTFFISKYTIHLKRWHILKKRLCFW